MSMLWPPPLPPHVTRPDWECPCLLSGKSGKEHQKLPLARSMSTDLLLGGPPVMIIAEKILVTLMSMSMSMNWDYEKQVSNA